VSASIKPNHTKGEVLLTKTPGTVSKAVLPLATFGNVMFSRKNLCQSAKGNIAVRDNLT
jgi:hypothetical protein